MKISMLRCERAAYDPSNGPRFETFRPSGSPRFVELWAFGRVFTWVVGAAA